VAVALDDAVDLDGAAGGDGGLAAQPWQGRRGRLRAGGAGAPHGQQAQVLWQQPGAQGAHQVPVQGQVDAAQVRPDGQGPPGQPLG
jgi:hypothetical protein